MTRQRASSLLCPNKLLRFQYELQVGEYGQHQPPSFMTSTQDSTKAHSSNDGLTMYGIPAKSPHSPPKAMTDHHPHAHSILLQMHKSCGPCCLCRIVSSLCTVPQAVYDQEGEEDYDGNASLWTDTDPANQMHRMPFIVGHRKFRLAFPGCQHGRQCTSVVTRPRI